MIVNRRYVLDRATISRAGGLIEAIEKEFQSEPLRWFVSEANESGVVVESTEYVGPAVDPLPAPERVAPTPGTDVVVSIVPTGVGCEVGGYAGDAGPATALLAAAAGQVVTNPNAVNASNFIYLDDRVLYTEGYGIDLFCTGGANLYVPRVNRIGVIIEQSDPAAVAEILNVLNTARAVYGLDIAGYVVTDGPIGTRCVRNASGAYVGKVDHPEAVLAATRELRDLGATAIAVTSTVRDLNSEDYAAHFDGRHPNPVGGAEAVISHLIAKTYHLPAAHAPMVNFKDFPTASGVVDARGAGEFVSPNGLACLLIGLRRAPQIVPNPAVRIERTLSLDNVMAVVAPASALGGIPVLYALRAGIPVIAVQGNGTVLDVTAGTLGLDGVIEVRNYAEAAGVVLALRGAISVESLYRPLTTLGSS